VNEEVSRDMIGEADGKNPGVDHDILQCQMSRKRYKIELQ